MISFNPKNRVVATVPLQAPPAWALLERELFRVNEVAWREFETLYCEPDGRLRYSGPMHDRDGVDDFYEPFFNWPVLYQLGGSHDTLVAAKKHWEGVTRQMTEIGFVVDEFERGYDWFHIGESMNFFYALCAADPADEKFRARALKFAELYLSGSASGNYDADRRMIVAPHNGSMGPRWGVGADWDDYTADQKVMQYYGLPLEDVEGINTWEDLRTADNSLRMGRAMQARMGRGDTAINLAATSLVTNAWLYDNDDRYADWVREYVGAWRERAEANDGLIPDNVGPSGIVGELHNGNFYGGHYGWNWPHGLLSVESAALLAVINESLVNSSTAGLQLARHPLEVVLSKAEASSDPAFLEKLDAWSVEKLRAPEGESVTLVPLRHGSTGWFDYQTLPLSYPTWLWWLTRGSSKTTDSDALVADDAVADAALIERLKRESGYNWSTISWSHDKEEQGHEAPWILYVQGQNPAYAVDALGLALAQVHQRLALMRANPTEPEGDDIHWWQRLNPVATEILTQLTTGAPPAVYNGGLQLARVRCVDARRNRPGLPPDVSALVHAINEAGVTVELVNLGASEGQEVVIQAGAYGEDSIDAVTYSAIDGEFPGSPHSYAIPVTAERDVSVALAPSPFLTVVLPPASKIRLTLAITRRVFTPAHIDFSTVDLQKQSPAHD
jgi:hypothetical protein